MSPPKGCLWASALTAFEVGLTPTPFMQTLVLLPEADRVEVSRFAKNFLPILFNLYGQPVAAGDTPAPRRAVLETVKTYLTITDPQVSQWRGGRNAVGGVLGYVCWKGPTLQGSLGLCHLGDRAPDTSSTWVARLLKEVCVGRGVVL